LPAGRIAALGATADFHHGLLARLMTVVSASTRSVYSRYRAREQWHRDNRVRAVSDLYLVGGMK